MSGQVRVDRIVAPYWRALPVEERAAIEAAIPDDHRVTVLARHGVFDLTARLLVDTHNTHGHPVYAVVATQRGRDLARTLRSLLGLPV